MATFTAQLENLDTVIGVQEHVFVIQDTLALIVTSAQIRIFA